MSNIILGRSLEAEIIQPQIGLEGWWDVKLVDARTQFIKRHLRFKNLIVNSGLNAIGNGTDIDDVASHYFGVGTGSVAPAATDTALGAEITAGGRTINEGGVSETAVYVAGPPDYFYFRRTRKFLTSQANGNLTEIGTFNQSTGGTMFSRSLFRDASNNPITIPKSNTEELIVTYDLRVYPPTADTTSSATIAGTSHTLTHRPQGVSGTAWGYWLFSNNWWNTQTLGGQVAETDVLVARTSTIGGTSCTSLTPAAYTNGNFYRDTSYFWDYGIANFATGIGMLASFPTNPASFNEFHKFQTKFAPKILKTNTLRLTLVMRESFGRYP